MSQNELDNFLRQKELEFEVPFEDKYWEQAQALIDRDRGTRVVAWWNSANVRLSALAILLGGLATWYAVSNQTITNETPVATTTEHVATSPYFENANDNDNVSAAGSGVNTTSDVNVSNNSSSTNSSSKAIEMSNNVTSKSSSKTTNLTTSSNIKSNSVSASSSVDNKPVSSNNNFSTSSNSNINSTNVSTQNLQNNRSDISIIHDRKAPYISYRAIHEIPVFEEMTPNDQSLLKFYGLYYKSEGNTSRKIRDFKRGAQYPLLNIAVVGGVNVFNQIKNVADTNIYVGVNPYIGGKVTYQWSPVMMVIVQPMLVQRGGIRLSPITDPITSSVYRHLYYLQLPVSLGFKLSKKNTVSVGGGVSILTSAGFQNFNQEKNKNEGYELSNKTDFANVDYFASLGYQYRLNRKISIQAAFTYGFTDITPNPTFGNVYNNNIQTSLGLTYQLYQNKIHFR